MLVGFVLSGRGNGERGNRPALGLKAAAAGAGMAATTVGPGAAAGVVLAALAWAALVAGERVLLRPRPR